MHIVGLGTDVVDLDRFALALDRTPKLRTRVFTGAELDYAAGRADPIKPLAARFAAKEALLKSLGLGLGQMRLGDIEVVNAQSGQPFIRLRGAAPRVAAQRGALRFLLSMSHSDRVAIATVIAQ